MKPLTRILLLVSLVAVAVTAVPATPAHAGKRMEAAIQDDGIFILFPGRAAPSVNREFALMRARQMGVTHIRLNVLWWQAVPNEAVRNQTTVPSNISYDFSPWDAAIARAKAWGIKSQIDLAGDPPAWACGNKRVPYACDGYKPNVRLWKGFVKAAAEHFDGRVKRYSIWNEPNWYTWLSPHKKAPLLYRKLVQTGYKKIKRVNKRNEVVAGELAPHFQPRISTPPLQFIREMVCVNKKLKRIKGAKRKCGKKPLKFDAFATHPYDFEHKPKFKRDNKDELTMSNVGELPELLNKLRKKGLIKTKKKKFPIYLTETGYMVENPQVKPRRQIPESKRKRWLVQAWKLAQKQKRVKQMLHYDFVSPRPGAPDGYFDMGLLTSTGETRPSYFALQNWIADAVADGRVARQAPCPAC